MSTINGKNIEAALFLTDGFETSEALTTLDILRRGKVNVYTVSLTGNINVSSQNKITVKADYLLSDIDDIKEMGMVILPGGSVLEGYKKSDELKSIIKHFAKEEKRISAICAAPVYLASLGILEGRTAVCYPALENELKGAKIVKDIVVSDKNIITSKGPATAMFFAFEILRKIKGNDVTEEVKEGYLVDLLF